MKPAVLLILSILIFGCTQRPESTELSPAEIDQHVNRILKGFGVTGAAVGIVKDGKIIHSKGYGVKSIKTGDPVDEQTQFAIASNTKAFTAAALAILADREQITWNDKVVDHIPEFKMYNEYVTQNFTIEDLLTHRSGLGLGAGDLTFIPDSTLFTIDDILTMFQYFEPVSAFRTQFDYDNILYIVAGELIARVSGLRWEEFVKQEILNKLGMNNTYAHLDSIMDKSNLATPHIVGVDNQRPIPHFKKMINGAAGGLYSSAEDLTQWLLVQLNEGKYGDNLENALFSPTRQREMWRIHSSFITEPREPYYSQVAGYGLGWELQTMNEKFVVLHGGLLPGMASLTVMIPDLDFGMVVLTNASTENGNGAASAILLPIADKLLGLENTRVEEIIYNNFSQSMSSSDSVTQAVWQAVETADDSTLDPNIYIGTYQDNWFGKVKILDRSGQLWFQAEKSPKLNGAMQFYKDNTFAIRWEYQDMNGDALAIFSLDEKGQAESIRMAGISPIIDFSFDFQDLDLRRVE